MVSDKRNRHYREIPYPNIKEIIIELFGFRIVLRNSEKVLTFLIPDSKEKNLLVKLMEDNAFNYVDSPIKVNVYDTTSSLVVQQNLNLMEIRPRK